MAVTRVQGRLAEDVERSKGSVECLGLTFGSEVERRTYFLARLREKLRDPGFRAIEGFPIGSDEDILALSDPPYYTACPNPFLDEFIQTYGKPYDEATDDYHREPFAADVSEGKTDALYRAHSYHTKVPHKAIMRYILHYTEPGDIVFDGFAGSGMVGVAAQACSRIGADLQEEIDAERSKYGYSSAQYGRRRAVLNDLSPAATFIAYNYTMPLDIDRFQQEGRRILRELDDEIGWMYETWHTGGKGVGKINYTVWSDVFACPACSQDVVFLDEALDAKSKTVRDLFHCPHCSTALTKSRLTRLYETYLDETSAEMARRVKRRPSLINYSVGDQRYEKRPDDNDLDVLARIERLPLARSVPANLIPHMHMTHERARMDNVGITHIHQFYLPREAQALGRLWQRADAVEDARLRHMLLFWVEQAVWGMSLMNRYQPIQHGRAGGSQVNRQMTGVYYVASQHSEVSPWYNLANKLDRLADAFRDSPAAAGVAITQTASCQDARVPSNSIDYIFTDPPFGENIYYADLNFLVESWHRVHTNAEPEAIIDRAKHKQLPDYQTLMQQCFQEYYRVVKPGRWMTVVFHNSRNSVWNAIQEALQRAGFVVADVRTMDKQQGSYRQVTSTAVKQDLVISAYKPAHAFEQRFGLDGGTEQGTWEFVRQHVENLPVFVSSGDKVQIIAERQNNRLYDRMVAYHIQRGATIPLSAAEFYAGLKRHFPERDGMYFLPQQVAEYDRKRLEVQGIEQLSLFVTDEQSTIQWLRAELSQSPKTYQELHPRFLRELHKAQYEHLPELAEILEQNFLRDERERWYVPDPTKQGDLEKLRERALLREFEAYARSRGGLKVFRSEAIRAGFRAAWRSRDYKIIVSIADRLPPAVVQEDSQVLMYYDNALDRVQE